MFKNIWVDPQEIWSNFYFQLRILQLSVKQMLILLIYPIELNLFYLFQ